MVIALFFVYYEVLCYKKFYIREVVDLLFDKIPSLERDHISTCLVMMNDDLAPVYGDLSQMAEAVRTLSENVEAISVLESVTSLTPWPAELVKKERTIHRNMVDRIKKLNDANASDKILRVAELSLGCAGILERLIWQLTLSNDEWMAIALLAHDFEELYYDLICFEFDPREWLRQGYSPCYELEDLPTFNSESLEINLSFFPEDDLPDGALSYLIKEMNSVYRLCKGGADPWVTYLIFKSLYNGDYVHVLCNGCEDEIERKAFEEFAGSK